MAERKNPTWQLRESDGTVVGASEGMMFKKATRLDMTLTNGGIVSLELWEREPGVVSLRALDGVLVLFPAASNEVRIRNRTLYESFHEAKEAAKTETKKPRKKKP